MVQEEEIRAIASSYYSRKDIQEAIFQFSKKREIVPRYIESFGKRPDSLEYPADLQSHVKRSNILSRLRRIMERSHAAFNRYG